MIELKDSLVEVRKAYRLLYDYQKKVLDLVDFIGSEFSRTYSGGHSKFSNSSPNNGRGKLESWAWDWLNMYYYEFSFHNEINEKDESNKSYFSIALLSDTGFYEAEKCDGKLDLGNYKLAAESSTKLYFIFGYNMWDCEGFLGNERWEGSKFLLEKSGVSEKSDKPGKMVFKSYDLEKFSDQKSTTSILRDFSSFCKENGLDFKLKRDIEIDEKKADN